METLRYDLAADGLLTITFDAPDAAVNTMTLAWQRDLAAAAAQAVADKARIRGVLLPADRVGHQTRSTTVAMPMPPPMHSVASP